MRLFIFFLFAITCSAPVLAQEKRAAPSYFISKSGSQAQESPSRSQQSYGIRGSKTEPSPYATDRSKPSRPALFNKSTSGAKSQPFNLKAMLGQREQSYGIKRHKITPLEMKQKSKRPSKSDMFAMARATSELEVAKALQRAEERRMAKAMAEGSAGQEPAETRTPVRLRPAGISPPAPPESPTYSYKKKDAGSAAPARVFVGDR